jgi:hypothetical protein
MRRIYFGENKLDEFWSHGNKQRIVIKREFSMKLQLRKKEFLTSMVTDKN